MNKSCFVYHTTEFNIKKFNLNYLSGGEHTFGPGIYFSTKSDNISYYLNENPKGHIYKTKINIEGQVQWHTLISDNILNKMLLAFPFIVTKKIKKKLFNKYSNKNFLYVFQNLPFEIYNFKDNISDFSEDNYLKKFLEKMSFNTGITSMYMQNGTFRDEIVVFNPFCLKIIKDIKEKTKKKKQTLKV